MMRGECFSLHKLYTVETVKSNNETHAHLLCLQNDRIISVYDGKLEIGKQ